MKLSNDTYGNMAEYDDWIYYIDYLSRNVYRMKLDGTGKTKVYNSETYQFKIENDFIYCLNACDENNDSKLYRINLDGTNKTKITDNKYKNFDISNGWIYYNGYQLGKMKLDGSEDMCIRHEGFEGTIWVTGNWIYFRSVNEHDHEILRQKIEQTSFKSYFDIQEEQLS